MLKIIATDSTPKIHEKYYGDRSKGYNVAMLKLLRPATEIQQVLRVKSSDHLQIGEELTTLGWGRSSPDGPFSTVLQETTFSVIDPEVCKQFLGSDAGGKMVCTGDGRTGICAGERA